MTRILVCGGREYANQKLVDQTLDDLQPTQIIHGAARGADSLAGSYARRRRIPCIPFPAHWTRQNGTTDYGAGIERNKRMLNSAKPDLVLAFPGGDGTRHMVSYARSKGYTVQIVQDPAGYHPTRSRRSRRR